MCKETAFLQKTAMYKDLTVSSERVFDGQTKVAGPAHKFDWFFNVFSSSWAGFSILDFEKSDNNLGYPTEARKHICAKFGANHRRQIIVCLENKDESEAICC